MKLYTGPGFSRRAFLEAAAAGAAVLGVGGEAFAGPSSLIARPPAGFMPLAIPGKIVKVSKSNTLQANGLWPTEEAAKSMLQMIGATIQTNYQNPDAKKAPPKKKPAN